MDANTVEIEWTPEAEAEMARVPFFVRGMARRAVVKAAHAKGVECVDLAFVNQIRAKVNPKQAAGGPPA